MLLQPRREAHVGRRGNRLRQLVPQARRVRGQRGQQHRNQPGTPYPGPQGAAGQRGPERQDERDLPAVQHPIGEGAEQVHHQVDDDRDHEDLVDQPGGERPAQHAAQRPAHQGQAGQVHDRERDGRGGVQWPKLAPNSVSRPSPTFTACRPELARGGQAERDRVQGEAADRADGLLPEPRHADRRGGRPGQGHPYQAARSAVPPATSRTARAVATMTSGTMATTSTRESATMAQASTTPAMTGTYQRGRARSSSSQTARAGTAVPMCPTDSSRMKMPAPSCGASMIPAVIAARATPSPDVARLCLLPPHPPWPAGPRAPAPACRSARPRCASRRG